MKNLILLLFVVTLYSSCEEQMVMIPETPIPPSERVIVLEELTGVRCPNCPAASATFKELLTLFDGKLVGYAIHGRDLVTPYDESLYNFSNPDAEVLEDYLPALGKPAGVINRVQYPGEDFWAIDDFDLWQSLIIEELSKPNEFNLNLSAEYDETSRRIDIDVSGIAVEDIDGELRINVALSESHIIDVQLEGGVGKVFDYEHNHVLRELLTDVAGDAIATDIRRGELINRPFSFTLPAEDGTWIAENMEIIAFLTNHKTDANGVKTEETVQAAAAHL